MGWEAWVTIGIVVLMIAAMARNLARPELVMLCGLAVLMTLSKASDRFPSPEQAIAGFGNEAPITVLLLFVVVAGLTQTNAMGMITQPLLGRPRSLRTAQGKLMLSVAGLSALLNNTPVVAMFMPVVSDWCKKLGFSPSKLFIPLSYAAVLGGLCTLIGTSTNIVIHGLYKAQNGGQGLGMFQLAWVGVPATIVGILYILVFSRWLLKDRKPAISPGDDPREYTVEMVVEPGSALVGQTIEAAGLRHLPGMYLVEIGRAGKVLAAVAPDQTLQADDRLIFAGIIESVVDLQKIRGLIPATDQIFKLDAPRSERCLVEAVVSNSCPLVGKTVREGRFRSLYNAAILAVARNGQRIRKKIGDIVLEAGDTLLIETHPSFVEQQRNRRDFFLVSKVEGAVPPRHDRAFIAIFILLAMVAVMGTGLLTPVNAALLAAGLMVITGCCTTNEAMLSIDWQVLLVIGASLGVAKAIDQTGAAQTVAHGMISAAGDHPWAVLLMVYAVTMLFTELLTNNAAAAIIFPIAWATAGSLQVNPTPFVVATAIAASCGFAMPLGYQTHMMVYGPGGYRFSDYLRIGLILNLLVMAVTCGLAPLVWPF